MIQVDITPRQLEADRAAELVVRLTNVGRGLCTNLVMRIDLPVQVVLLRGSDRIEVPQLDEGATFTRTLRVKPLQVGTWTLTSPNFSYQDAQGRARRIPDLRLGQRHLHRPGTTSGQASLRGSAQSRRVAMWGW